MYLPNQFAGYDWRNNLDTDGLLSPAGVATICENWSQSMWYDPFEYLKNCGIIVADGNPDNEFWSRHLWGTETMIRKTIEHIAKPGTIRRARETGNPVTQDDHDQLAALLAYVEHHGPRDEVPGWTEMRQSANRYNPDPATAGVPFVEVS